MELKSVTPFKDLFYLTWDIGPRCNFSCSYCPPRLHDKVSQHKSLEELQRIWSNLYKKTVHRGKSYRVDFTGGEVTLNPNFLPFIRWMRVNYSDISEISFSTNGTASIDYYREAIHYVNDITFSSHFEFAKFDKLWKNILKTHIASVKLRKLVYVCIMEENNYAEEMKNLEELCIKHRVPYSVIKVDEDYFGVAN